MRFLCQNTSMFSSIIKRKHFGNFFNSQNNCIPLKISGYQGKEGVGRVIFYKPSTSSLSDRFCPHFSKLSPLVDATFSPTPQSNDWPCLTTNRLSDWNFSVQPLVRPNFTFFSFFRLCFRVVGPQLLGWSAGMLSLTLVGPWLWWSGGGGAEG